MRKVQDDLRARVRAAKAECNAAGERWKAACAAAGLVEKPNSFTLGRDAARRLKEGAPLHPTDLLYAGFCRLFDIADKLQGDLARRDDPRRQPPARRPKRRAVANGNVRTGRYVRINGVRVPVVEYV